MVAVVLSLVAMRLTLVLVGRTFGQVVYVPVGLVLVASVTEDAAAKNGKKGEQAADSDRKQLPPLREIFHLHPTPVPCGGTGWMAPSSLYLACNKMK